MKRLRSTINQPSEKSPETSPKSFKSNLSPKEHKLTGLHSIQSKQAVEGLIQVDDSGQNSISENFSGKMFDNFDLTNWTIKSQKET